MAEKPTEFQKMLQDGYIEFLRKTGKRKASDNAYAKWLGVTPPSLNQWINGYREPNFENALLLSEKLGPEIMEILGYPMVVSASDPRLQYIVKHWRDIDDETQDLMYEHAQEEVSANVERRQKQREGATATA